MCGIAGKLSLDGPVDPRLMERMCAVLEHRGPDSRGVFLDDGVGFGVQRLAVIDPAGGDQPIYNEDGSIVVVLNGEIYNYGELRESLSRRGHRLVTSSDTEVVVHLYEEHGDACVEHLRGMFAFALWDRTRRRLLLARDRIGKKPLLYAQTPSGFWFGSEARAILEDPAVPRDFDPVAIDNFLHYRCVPQPWSAFAALRKLPPAHVLTWEGGRTAIRRYWKLSYRPDLAGKSEPELHELIREHLLEATRLRLRSDVPLGALLSGGIDSSSVVAAMARTSTDRVKTFSVGFDVESYDETPYARAVAHMYDTDHREVWLGPEAVEALPRLVWHHGEPFADASAIATFHLSELASRDVTVALAGDGGDENFAGYHRYGQIVRQTGGPLTRVERVRARLGLRIRARGAEAVLERHGELVSHLSFGAAERRALYEPEFLRSLREPAWRSVIGRPYSGSDAPDLVGRLLDLDFQTYLPDDILVKVDIASMAHSLEVRSPLLDHVFVETVAAIPAELKLARGAGKAIYRAAIRDWLPDRLLARPKQGFGVPLCEWFRGRLRELPADVLLDPRAVDRGLFRVEGIRRLIDHHRTGGADNSAKLWALIQLELWLRAYVDRRRMEAPPALALA